MEDGSTLPYNHLVLAVGAQAADQHTQGLANAFCMADRTAAQRLQDYMSRDFIDGDSSIVMYAFSIGPRVF